ncbi:MAG TPA: tetratricopeptide repeat protein, partial [Candidatus Methanoperedens sp.]|nr:tetratricopeptide repeat protein [Candidatus Methanoperedens sp.]
MAADKRTLARDALKQVQAGKIEKAVETYRAIVKLDPRDASVRNSLGDLLGKLGKKKDAIAEFLEASALFERDGFGLRAIATCQKAVNLDGEQWGVRLKLGDLYAAQKLPAEARAVYIQVADRHDKRGEVAAALDVFRKIADLDPENLPVRVKLGGMFEKQKQPDKAAAEYVRAGKAYAARKEGDKAVQLLVRAFKLSPANLEARRLLADFYAQRQDWQVVVGLLETPVVRGVPETGLVVLYAE